MEPVSALKDAARVLASAALASAARLDGGVRARTEAALHRADLPTRADLRRLHARLAALHRAADEVGVPAP